MSSRPLWLLLSAAVAFGVLAWSAQREPSLPRIDVYGSAGTGFFRRVPPSMISGIDTITPDRGSTTCLTFTWGHRSHSTGIATPCVSGTAQWQLRKLP